MRALLAALMTMGAVLGLALGLVALVNHARSAGRAGGRAAVLTEQSVATATAQAKLTTKAADMQAARGNAEARVIVQTEELVRDVQSQSGASDPLPYDVCMATRRAIDQLREGSNPSGDPPCVGGPEGSMPPTGG